MNWDKKLAAWLVAIYFGGAFIGPQPVGFEYAGLTGWLPILAGALVTFVVLFTLAAVGMWAEGNLGAPLRIERR